MTETKCLGPGQSCDTNKQPSEREKRQYSKIYFIKSDFMLLGKSIKREIMVGGGDAG